jgi:predicted transcriptional regulator
MEEVETLIQQRQKQTTSESHKAKMAGLSKRTVAFVATDQIEIGKEEL